MLVAFFAVWCCVVSYGFVSCCMVMCCVNWTVYIQFIVFICIHYTYKLETSTNFNMSHAVDMCIQEAEMVE